jgi:hypothetical protein
VKLKALTPAHVRSLYREKLEAGSSARTVRYIHTTLHKALKQAVMDGLIPRNATEAVKPPQPSREEMHPLTPDQAKLLLQVAPKALGRAAGAFFYLCKKCSICRRFSSTGGRARTDTVLSHHRILSPSRLVYPCSWLLRNPRI